MKSPSSLHKSSLILLGLLALIFRYPITPSPTGTDNFFYITEIIALTSYGQIFWADEWLSLYGLFPGTSPLGGTIIGSSIVEISDIPIHNYQLIHSLFFSVLSIFGFFMLSGEFTKNFYSRWFGSLCFSLAPRLLLLSQWRVSFRLTLIAMLPFFVWILLRTVNEKYSRYPVRIYILLFIFALVLPSLHRMALLFPGMILALFLSIAFNYWQESATNRERAGRQVLGTLVFFALYLFYLQYHDFTPYNPSDMLFEIYLFSGNGIISSFLNIVLYYLLAIGPPVFFFVLALIFWFQEGQVPISYFFGLTYLTLSMFIVADHIYIAYLITFGLLFFMFPGIDFFIDNLQDYPKRLTILFVSLLMLFLSFSTSYLHYQVDSHDRENLYYSYYMRDSSFSMSFWLDENVESAIFECNDVKRERRVAAYSNMTNIEDSLELSSGLVDVSEMSVKRISVKEMYWNASDHLWVWENGSNFSSEITTNKTISIVNLGMPNASGKSSTGSVALDYHYKNMPSFTYKLYSNSELASYWSFNY